MSIDTITPPRYINIVLDDNPKYLNQLRAVAESEGQNEDGDKKISLTQEGHTFEMDEFDFDSKENEISFSGTMKGKDGDSYFSLAIPLTDSILIDILHHSIKKFNKIKTLMETMK